MEALADASGDYRLVILFLAYTGLRFDELSALRVRRLDLMRRRAEILEAVAEVGGRAVFGTPKSHQVRSVPIPRFLVDELAEHVAGKSPDEFVFTSPRGGLLRLQNFRHTVFDRAARVAGLDNLTPHSLRQRGVAGDRQRRRREGRPADARPCERTMTLDLYGHLYGDRLDEVADRMDALRTSRGLPADFLRTDAQLIMFPELDQRTKAQQISDL